MLNVEMMIMGGAWRSGEEQMPVQDPSLYFASDTDQACFMSNCGETAETEPWRKQSIIPGMS
jgi:hypothetical protein